MKAELNLITRQVALDGAPVELAEFIGSIEGFMPTAEIDAAKPIQAFSEKELTTIRGMASRAMAKAMDDRIINGDKTETPKAKAKKAIGRKILPSDKFIELYKAGTPMKDIASALKASTKSMYNLEARLIKAGKIKKRIVSKAKKNPKHWTESQLTELKSLADSDEPLKVMAKHIGRPLNEVRAKLQELANKGKINPATTALTENVTA